MGDLKRNVEQVLVGLLKSTPDLPSPMTLEDSNGSQASPPDAFSFLLFFENLYCKGVSRVAQRRGIISSSCDTMYAATNGRFNKAIKTSLS